MNWRDIFTAPAALYVFLVAVVRVPIAVQLMENQPSRTLNVLVATRTQIGCLINSGWRKHQNLHVMVNNPRGAYELSVR